VNRWRPLIGGAAAACAAQLGALAGSTWPRFTIDNSALGADGVRAGDVNRDGLPDVVSAWEISGDVRFSIRPEPCGATAPWTSATIAIVPGCEDTLPVDLDGDGALDFVTCAERATSAVFVHWAPVDAGLILEPTAWTTEQFTSPPTQYWMYAVPLQLDGKHGVDLVIGPKNDAPDVLVELGWLRAPADPRDVGAWPFVPIGPVGWVMSMLAEDMDGDGDQDLLVFDRFAALRAVRWLANPGAEHVLDGAPWESVVVGFEDLQVVQGAVADIDGDGLQDVVAAARLHRLSWFERLDATGRKWEEHRIHVPPMTGAVKAVHVADMDLDGLPDLVVTFAEADAPLSGVYWFRQPANPVSTAWDASDISGPEGSKFDAVVIGDFDGDGDPDVAATDEHDNTTGDGLGLVWYANVTVEVSTDVNGDGIVDFADLIALLDEFGQTGPALAGDVDHDDDVDFDDLLLVLGHFNMAACTG
jgi:hypothetical protein